MSLVIRKKITLEFLGDEYKDAYLVFKAIPVGDLQGILDRMPKEDSEDKSAAIGMMLEVLKKYFLTGEFPDENGVLQKVVPEDVDNIDADVAIHCFQGLSGASPKAQGQSENSSSPSTLTELPDPNPQPSI